MASLATVDGIRFDGGGFDLMVDALGDVNGDGLGDLVIGASQLHLNFYVPHPYSSASILFGGAANFGGPVGVAGDDVLYGVGAPSVLDGGFGNDRIYGDGNDETLLGGPGDDLLSGGYGMDRLSGGAGADVLTGGPDADAFVFAFIAGGSDRITDFTPGQDVLEISASGFGGGLAAGAAPPLTVGVSPVAVSGDGQFLYDSATGHLYWDRDGYGVHAPIEIAFLDGMPALGIDSFRIIG